jgi:Uncharacterized protein conserved in bacteria
MKVITDIYRSGKKEGMYLYVRKGFDLQALPEALRQQFGRAELAMSLLITPDKTLARADASVVLKAIESQDFYLQIPPTGISEGYMQNIPNDKMGKHS